MLGSQALDFQVLRIDQQYDEDQPTHCRSPFSYYLVGVEKRMG